jgi:phosphopantothenate synthetase
MGYRSILFIILANLIIRAAAAALLQPQRPAINRQGDRAAPAG